MWANQLTPAQADAVRDLAERCRLADGTAPLNEDAQFALTDASADHLLLATTPAAALPTSPSSPSSDLPSPELSDDEGHPGASATGCRGVSTTGAPAAVGTEAQPATGGTDSDNSGERGEGRGREGREGREGALVGYLQWQRRHGTGQLLVDPAHRRRGIGSKLLAELAARTDPALWAFGDLLAAQSFAAAHDLRPSRALLMMSRSLADAQKPAVPDDVTLRGYTDADADELLAVNAAAFAHHPEQGGLDADGLARRISEDWFDPNGLILALDADGLAGFHWTKAEHGVGEVYVVGVHPRAQGRGYGRLLLEAGLSHLADKGLHTVELYVDAADAIAVRMYERAGFTEAHRDVLYTHTQE